VRLSNDELDRGIEYPEVLTRLSWETLSDMAAELLSSRLALTEIDRQLQNAIEAESSTDVLRRVRYALLELNEHRVDSRWARYGNK
jgi:hypothetical protein